jgi:hypothetical protein
MFRLFACLTVMLVVSRVSTAEAGIICHRGGCKPACECGVVWGCCPKYEKEKVTKSGFEVECEQICVPKVRLPWADPCEPRCAFVVSVNRLKKVTKDNGEKCVLTWEAKPFCSHCLKPACGTCPEMSCAPSE